MAMSQLQSLIWVTLLTLKFLSLQHLSYCNIDWSTIELHLGRLDCINNAEAGHAGAYKITLISHSFQKSKKGGVRSVDISMQMDDVRRMGISQKYGNNFACERTMESIAPKKAATKKKDQTLNPARKIESCWLGKFKGRSLWTTDLIDGTSNFWPY